MTYIDFLADPGGTRVRVRAYLRTNGATAFLFWPNVIGWLAAYVTEVAGDGPPAAVQPSTNAQE
jgi:hypothetical protein